MNISLQFTIFYDIYVIIMKLEGERNASENRKISWTLSGRFIVWIGTRNATLGSAEFLLWHISGKCFSECVNTIRECIIQKMQQYQGAVPAQAVNPGGYSIPGQY